MRESNIEQHLPILPSPNGLFPRPTVSILYIKLSKPASLQIPRVAIQSRLHPPLCQFPLLSITPSCPPCENERKLKVNPKPAHPSHLLLVSLHLLVALGRRYWPYRPAFLPRLPRWYVCSSSPLPPPNSFTPISFSSTSEVKSQLPTQLTPFLLRNQIADTLDRYEMPFFGGLASSFVDAE